MKILKILSIFIGLAFLVSGAAYGATIKVPDEYSTIQEAIDAAVNGDNILVAPGTYGGANFWGKNITVRSDEDGDPATYDILPHATIIEYEQVHFLSGETESSVLNGFTMRDCLGCIQIGYNSSPTIKNCILSDSSCGDGCGIQVHSGASPTIINSIFYNNNGQEGAGADIQWSSSAKFINCTFYGNTANTGAAIHAENSSSVTLINCIFWGNSASQGHEIAIEDNSTVTVSYSDIQGGQSEVFVDLTSTLNWVSGTNINSNPLFVDAAGEDFHLQYGSLCIDAATASDPDLPATDYEGDSRVVGFAPDMGADEFMLLIDIKPGSYPNSINPPSEGKIPVTILSSMDFDAPTEVDTESLTFGPTGDEESLAFCSPSFEDVNDDGYDDIVCHFYTQMTGFECGDEEGILKGQTVDEIPVEGSDSVRIVPSACR
jgi:hypothetical protein